MPKNFLYFVILSFSVIVSWIIFGVYHNYTTTTISNDTNILITPISASFDEDVINNILKRSVVPADLSGVVSSTSASPSPTPIQSGPTPTQAQLEPTQSQPAETVATTSAEL